MVLRVCAALSQPLVFLRQLLHRLEIDRTAIIAGMGRGWQVLSGFVTMLLIVSFFTKEMQGYYYTFATLMSLQFIAEIGLGHVIVQFASHEWAKLTINNTGKVSGEPIAQSRLASFMRFILAWYSIGALASIVGLGAGGYLFFSQSSSAGVDWYWPWIFMSTVTGLYFLVIGVLGFLEGCNQVAFVYRYRLIQGVASSAIVWLLIFLGAGLWITVIPAAMGLVLAAVLMLRRYRTFFASLFTVAISNRIHWKEEIWPFQWRIVISLLSGLFINSLFTPVMFHYHGAVIAGQTGLTLAVITNLPVMGLVLIQPKLPLIAMMVAAKDYERLDRFFRKISITVLSVGFLGACAVFIVVYWLYAFGSGYSSRILSPLATGLLLLMIMVRLVLQLQRVYLHAHKKEPLMWLSVAAGLAMGLSIWQLGSRYAAMGAVSGCLAVTLLIELPWSSKIFSRKRQEWHNE
ncbi:MAG: hypothetical protein HY743_03840 [Deltaproteobacteria bacterium]|nr:hypothetical protein [Deltaproteobacteria bacterium]